MLYLLTRPFIKSGFKKKLNMYKEIVSINKEYGILICVKNKSS